MYRQVRDAIRNRTERVSGFRGMSAHIAAVARPARRDGASAIAAALGEGKEQ